MRKSLSSLAILLLFVSCAVFSQSNKNLFQSIKSFTLHPKSKNVLEGSLPFTNIEVIDARFDTTKLGYLHKGYKYRQLVTQKKLNTELSNFLTANYQKNLSRKSDLTLVLVVKHLWLKEKEGVGFLMGIPIRNFFSRSESVIEAYARDKHLYIPLFKSDTTILKYESLSKRGDELVSLPFTSCLKKLVSWKESELLALKRKVSFDEVSEHNKRRFDHPIFINSSLTKGVFLTFEDFLNNKPVTEPFGINLNNQIDEVYWVNDNAKKVVEKFWGFCDGKQYFIKLGNNFYPIYKDCQTYSLWGNANITYRRTQFWFGGSNTDATLKKSMRNKDNGPLQVNMETGAVY